MLKNSIPQHTLNFFVIFREQHLKILKLKPVRYEKSTTYLIAPYNDFLTIL